MKEVDQHHNLIDRCCSGNRQAQFELYRLYSQAMYNVCLRMLKHTSDAEDVLQTSFVDIYKKLGTYRYESTLGAWIKRIVINNCIDYSRKKKMQLVELDPVSWESNAFVSNEQDVSEEHYQLNVERIKKAMQLLPDGYRVVFSLYQFEGYDHQEIGEILGVTESTSKSQYSRARQKLRDILLSDS